MPSAQNPLLSNSFDAFLRGQEIASGAQRVHDPEILGTLLDERAVPVSGALAHYVAALSSGAPPHGGVGLGLERVLALSLGLENVRQASMWPRTPGRLGP